MDLEQNPFAFLGEEEDADVLIQNAKASAAAAALAAKEAAMEEGREKKDERKNEYFSMKAKRIILPRYVTRRDIIVRKEKKEEGNGGNFRQNSVPEAHRSNGCNSFNGHSNGYHHGGYQRNYRRGSNGNAYNGGRHQNQGFNGNDGNASNQKLEKKVEQVSNGVEKNVEEEDGWTRIEKRRSKGRRSGSYQSSQVSTVSEKDTTLEDVQEASNVENNASVKDATLEDVQEVSNVENNASEKDSTCEDVNNASEKELGGEVEQDINAENNVAEAVNVENKSNETERQQKSSAAGDRPRTKKNGSQKRKNKNKNIEAAQIVSQKKEELVANVSLNMTLQEYEKSLVEKRKALESLKKTENSRVIQLKDFEPMVHVGKNTVDGLSTNQNSKDSHNYKKDGHKEEEKGHKVVSRVELRKKWGLTFNHPTREPFGGMHGGNEVGMSDKEAVKGNGEAEKTELSGGFDKRGHHKIADTPLEVVAEVVAEKEAQRLPAFENLEQFPKLGRKAA